MIKKAIILGIFCLFWGCVDDTPQVYKVKFSHVVSPHTPKGQAADFFAKRVEELSKGRIQVEVFPNAQLVDDDKVFQELTRNNVQMAAPSFSKFTPMAQEFNVWDIPFLFTDIKHVHQMMESDIGERLKGIISSRGVIALAYWDAGFKQFSTSKQAIILPEDIKGQKIRVMNSKVLEEQIKAFDGIPQIMSFSEVYTALSSGLVDGAENPLSNLYASRFYEVQNSITLTNHGYLGYLVVVSDGFWKQLPDDLKEIFLQALNETTIFERKQSAKAEKELLTKLKKASGKQIKIISLDKKQQNQWRESMQALYPKYYKIVGQDLIEEITQLRSKQDSSDSKQKN